MRHEIHPDRLKQRVYVLCPDGAVRHLRLWRLIEMPAAFEEMWGVPHIIRIAALEPDTDFEIWEVVPRE